MFFRIDCKLEIKLPKKLINDTVKEMIYGFLYRSVKVDYIPHDKNEIIIGEPSYINYEGESAYKVTEKGVYISGKDEKSLLTALFMVLQEIEPICLEEGKEELRLLICEKQLAPKIERRMIHFCLFPKIPLSSYRKLIRLAGVMGITHIILEFWGTLKYQSLKELAWKNLSFSKEEIASLLKEMRELLIEPIPMLNHFGHATQSRMCNGKHVVLDQNPRLATLFSPDGWWWRFDKKEVKKLLKDLRQELIDLFGEGEFFHLGMDESFSYPTDIDSSKALGAFLKELCEEVKAQGRIPMLWGDMFLHEPTLGIGKATGYEGNCPSAETAELLINALPQDAIVCDWQYFVKESPWKSVKYFVEKGIKTAICPWQDYDGVKSGIKTAIEYSCHSFIQTTWHTVFMHGNISSLLKVYYELFGINKTVPKIDSALYNASLLRKIWFADGDYEKSGWVKVDVRGELTE